MTRIKLGFWNRLALVLGGLLSVGGGSLFWLVSNRQQGEIHAKGYGDCIKAVTDWDLCSKVWNADPWPYYGWDFWAFSVFVLAVVSVFFYALAWVGVIVAKWIWRGREVDKLTS
jgi:hypothetical protein